MLLALHRLGNVHGQTAVIVITGTSGAGKGTLEEPLMQRIPGLELAVSATTRKRRANEVDGVHYWFISHDEFERRVQAGEFLEYITHPWGQRHGTLRSEIERIRGSGRVPLLDLETEGAKAVKEELPEAVTIFVKAPTLEELARRLRERATESDEEIDKRLERARLQLSQEHEFDYVIVNDRRERAVEELAGIVERELSTAGTISAP